MELISYFLTTSIMLTLKRYLTADNKYPDRETHVELNDEIKKNAEDLLKRVNALLIDLGIDKVSVSSGFRTSAVNANTPGSAKKSAHMTGRAVDLVDDKNQTICKKILAKPELLKKHGLWMEDPAHTIGRNTNWCHLDVVDRKDRPIRVFKP